jgi:hypothetical protein
VARASKIVAPFCLSTHCPAGGSILPPATEHHTFRAFHNPAQKEKRPRRKSEPLLLSLNETAS